MFVEENMADLLAAEEEPGKYFVPPERELEKAGSEVDPDDPLAVLALKGPAAEAKTKEIASPEVSGPSGTVSVLAPLQGMVIEFSVGVGEEVQKNQPVAVMEALKMEHVIKSEVSGVVRELALEVGDTIFESTPIMFIEPLDVEGEYDSGESQDLDEIRPDVAEVNHFHELTRDDARVEAAE